MPGTLYFYSNFAIIKLNKDEHSKVKSFDHPWLRDLEWEFFYNWTEARGFSGFIDDDEYTCHRMAESPETIDMEYINTSFPNLINKAGVLKRYVAARDYLRMVHDQNQGRPLFENDALNMMMMGSRGFGKSYSVAALIAHEWLMDGMTHYTTGNVKNPTSTEVVVGAGDAKFSSDLLNKVTTMIDRLPGDVEIDEKYYPCPLSQQGKGSWMPSKRFIASYDKKMGGTWVTKGSQSSIKHLTYKDNPFAAAGTRPAIMAFEEIGMFANLLPSHIAGVECMRDGSRKFGSGLYLGTGGDMEGGGTLDASRMFYDPVRYDLLQFEDVWENRGKIGYFVPAYLGLNKFKDDNGNTNVDSAIKFLQAERSRLRDSKSGSAALDGELQNRPLVPSEAFLTKSGNIFPVAELRERLTTLETADRWSFLETVVHLYFDPNTPTGVNYTVDVKNELQPINLFPWSEPGREGAVVLYELPMTGPEGIVPEGLYIIGHDPYATEDPEGESNATIYVTKTKAHLGRYGHDEVVAEFIGRPYAGRKIVNEILLKLSLFYGNAKIFFENVRGNTKEYFEKNKKLILLAKQPQTVMAKKAAHSSGSRGTVPYGYPMSGKHMKIEGLHYIRDWLMEERGDSEDSRPVRNLDKIYSKGLLQELIGFNLDGNFDRVMGFMGCIIGMEETYNQYEQKIKDESVENSSKGLGFIINNATMFEDPKTQRGRKLIDRQRTPLPQYAFQFEALKNN